MVKEDKICQQIFGKTFIAMILYLTKMNGIIKEHFLVHRKFYNYSYKKEKSINFRHDSILIFKN
jgi:purine-cytosine permease-like protein